jgi:stage II sporulation protein D
VIKKKLLIFIILANSLLPSTPANNSQMIRVLLKEGKTNNPVKFKLHSDSGFWLSKTPTKKNTKIEEPDLEVTLFEEKIILKSKNGTKFKSNSNKLIVSPIKEHIQANDIPYDGFIFFHTSRKNHFQMINWVDLEDYIYSVLRYEVYQSWPEEMHAVQAIASRTYAAHCMEKAKKRHRTFDIKNSNFHQVYRGTHKYEHLKTAIKKTCGTILSYNGSAAVTMYDACCGGFIPARIGYFDFNGKPYLKREYPCQFCKNYSLYRWKHVFKREELEQNLKKHHLTESAASSIGKIENIEVAQGSCDGVGIGQTVNLVGTKGISKIRGAEFFEIVRHKAKSRSFSISKEKDQITLNGGGFGHLVGMCQRGARELVRREWNLKKILSFYYPGTSLVRLESVKGPA